MRLAQSNFTSEKEKLDSWSHTHSFSSRFRWWRGWWYRCLSHIAAVISGSARRKQTPVCPSEKSINISLTYWHRHTSSSAAVAAADGSQLRLLSNLFVGSSFVNRGQKRLKDVFFSFTLPLAHTRARASLRGNTASFVFLATIAGSPRKITQTFLCLILGQSENLRKETVSIPNTRPTVNTSAEFSLKNTIQLRVTRLSSFRWVT